jgi:protein-tyrosine kinase
MASPPRTSLVERLVQDRLRSGDLEASAAQLLRVGDGAPAEPGLATPVNRTGTSANSAALGDTDGSRTLIVDPVDAAPTTRSLLDHPAFGMPTDVGVQGAPPLSPAPLSSAPMALELRPLIEPAPSPAPATPMPIPGMAPSALVPPPATALPVSAKPASVAPVAELALPPTPAPAPEPPALAPAPATPFEINRPDLVQGPPTIDAVALERGGMVDWSRTRSRISEEFRLIQRQILRAAFGPGAEPGFSNLLMVTSARPGEGKSFTSVNLAGSIARQGDHHVLLVDADSKRDSFCYALGLAEMRGLLDLVANPKLDPSPLIVKTPIDRLSILPVGRERERSAELFSTKEMTRLIQSLGRRYADRLLILDAPPCLSTSDPAVLAPVVGQILFVVEADRTQRDEVEASLDLIQACPNITLVLNKQQISSRYTFGAYSSYYSS